MTRYHASLFSPDRKPVPTGEMERYFRMMAYSRADLMGLVRGIQEEALDWMPHPESFIIRRLLRHIGNAEQWYVSWLVPSETLLKEWDHDEAMPIFEFLEMVLRC